jgi:hypothetical protein
MRLELITGVLRPKWQERWFTPGLTIRPPCAEQKRFARTTNDRFQQNNGKEVALQKCLPLH